MMQRFVDAQQRCFDAVLAELRAGRKRTHWMWFVFPQLKALGRSQTAQYYGIDNLDDAIAYLAHPLLGARLKACVQALLAQPCTDPHDIFGYPDDLKFRSCLTLFRAAAPHEPVFDRALTVFYGGHADEATLALLSSPGIHCRATCQSQSKPC